MFNRMAVASLFLGLVLASVPGVLEAASGSGRNKAGKVEGVLTFLSANRVVIRNQSGTAVSLQVVPSTKVELNGVRVPLSRLRVGRRTQALFNPTTRVATKVEQ
ncbi:MAG: hypothetical protein KDA86_25745 [Planctomycetaceae bacterium]|nr:hypothetical protein [Planctomycetaceae bacterium]